MEIIMEDYNTYDEYEPEEYNPDEDECSDWLEE